MQFVQPPFQIIEFSGEKTDIFLQGQLTCDVLSLKEGNTLRGALCNLKGRVLALIDLCIWENKWYGLVASDLLPIVFENLQKPALFSRVQMKIAEKTIPPFQFALENAYLFHKNQLENHTVLIHEQTSGKYLPHELNFHLSPIISFNKGCYKGQEIIARMHYRGKLKYELIFKKFTINNSPNNLIPGNTLPEGELIDCCQINEQIFLVAVSQPKPNPIVKGDNELI